MKRSTLTAIVIASITLSLSAEPGSCGGHGNGNEAGNGNGQGHQRMVEELNLTEEQQADLETAREEYQAAREALHEEHIEDMKEILTDEQFTQFEAIREQRRGNRCQGQGQGQGQGRQHHGGSEN